MSDSYVPIEGHKWLKRREPGGIYYTVRRRNGKLERTSLKTRDEAEAITLYEQHFGKRVAANRTIRVPEAFAYFISNPHGKYEVATIDRFRSSWDTWCADLLEHLTVAEVDPADIDRVITRAETAISPHTGRPLSESSKNRIKDVMGAFFKSCTKEPTRYRDDNPVAHVAKRSFGAEIKSLDEQHIVKDDEVDAIVNALGDWIDPHVFKLRTIFQLMPKIGTRIDETLALKTTSIKDGERFGPYGSLLIEEQIGHKFKANDDSTWFSSLKGSVGTIGDRKRLVPLSLSARTLLDTYIERGEREGFVTEGELLFSTARGKPFQSSFVGGKLKKAAEAAGIGRRIKSHYFRHTYATKMFTNGASVGEVAMLLGNSEAVTKAVYIHFLDRVDFSARMASLVD
jgi:site-specific recombinase XerD